jgi:hypothetical protein
MKSLFFWLLLVLLSIYAWHWSKASLVEPKPAFHIEYSIADINKDGIVNMLDQAIVAANWGRKQATLTYTDTGNPQGIPVYYDPNMPASEFEQVLK